MDGGTRMVGSNKPIDTNKYFVICTNVLGGCVGSTGPKEINAITNSLLVLTFHQLQLEIW